MKIILGNLAVLLAAAMATSTGAIAQDKPVDKHESRRPQTSASASKPAGDEYKELLARLKGGDTTVDFTKLRMAFTKTENYSYHGMDKADREKMTRPLGEKRYKEALKAAEKLLETDYVNPNTHYVAYLSNKELKDATRADFHKSVLLGLLNSITSNNDGLSAKTAFFPITIEEEYALMNFLGYKVSSQGLNSIDGHQFDVFEAVDPKTSAPVKLYFNIDKIWEAETKIFKK